ncbi:hypothetical protein ACFZC3_24505 [Streptomyces sp. NPDC007903]|uniref:hypothetical protein n=1 Tax=Streptomyces sp. NPDC007903 TaxID=3364786 RepID=UPI0036EE8771
MLSHAGEGAGGFAPAHRPTGRPWTRAPGELTVRTSEAQVEASVPLGHIGVDRARVLFGDVDVLNAWQHHEPVHGLTDVAFWGAAANDAAATFAAAELDEPGVRGWTGLTVAEAVEKARAVQGWALETGRRLMVDFRPHSHHWQITRQLRAPAHESGTPDIGPARVLCAMTTWGDGYFPVSADLDASGGVVAVRVRFPGRRLSRHHDGAVCNPL